MIRLLALVVLLVWVPGTAIADGPFDQGRIRVAAHGASGRAFGDSYFVLGYGVGVFVLDGLEVGVDADHWLGGEPVIHKLSEQVRYVFHMVPSVHPYLGAFHKHWFIGDDVDDIDTLGGRLGLFFSLGPQLFAGGGVVHEVIVTDCEDDCSETYPEVVFSAVF